MAMLRRCTVLLVWNVLLLIVICEELASSFINTNTHIDVVQAAGEGWRSRALMQGMDQDTDLESDSNLGDFDMDQDTDLESDSNFGDSDVCPDGAQYKKRRCRGGKVVEDFYETYKLFRQNDVFETSEPIDNNPRCLPAVVLLRDPNTNLKLPESIVSVFRGDSCLKDAPDGMEYIMVMYPTSDCSGEPMYTIPAIHSRCDGTANPPINMGEVNPCVFGCPVVQLNGQAFIGGLNSIARGDLTVLKSFCEMVGSAEFSECSLQCYGPANSYVRTLMAMCAVDKEIMDAVGSEWQVLTTSPKVKAAVTPTAVPGASGGMRAMASLCSMLAIVLLHLLL